MAFIAGVGAAVWVSSARAAAVAVATASASARAAPGFHPRVRQLAMHSTDPGSEGDTVVATVERKITEALNPTKLSIIPAYDDPNGSHVTIRVVSEAFAGKNVVQRHKMVYKTIWEELQGPIHAVDEITAKTPAEDA